MRHWFHVLLVVTVMSIVPLGLTQAQTDGQNGDQAAGDQEDSQTTDDEESTVFVVTLPTKLFSQDPCHQLIADLGGADLAFRYVCFGQSRGGSLRIYGTFYNPIANEIPIPEETRVSVAAIPLSEAAERLSSFSGCYETAAYSFDLIVPDSSPQDDGVRVMIDPWDDTEERFEANNEVFCTSWTLPAQGKHGNCLELTQENNPNGYRGPCPIRH